jgi:hypothetical protein
MKTHDRGDYSMFSELKLNDLVIIGMIFLVILSCIPLAAAQTNNDTTATRFTNVTATIDPGVTSYQNNPEEVSTFEGAVMHPDLATRQRWAEEQINAPKSRASIKQNNDSVINASISLAPTPTPQSSPGSVLPVIAALGGIMFACSYFRKTR